MKFDYKYYYIHGYNSTGQTTYNGLKNAGLSELKLVSWTSDRPYQETLNEIKSQIDFNAEVIIIASSFGGFWATQLPYKVAQIYLINPLIDPYKAFLENHFSENFTKEIAETYKNKKDIITGKGYPITLYLSKNDDVLDYKIAEKYFKKHSQTIYMNSGHILKDYKTVVKDVEAHKNLIAE